MKRSLAQPHGLVGVCLTQKQSSHSRMAVGSIGKEMTLTGWEMETIRQAPGVLVLDEVA